MADVVLSGLGWVASPIIKKLLIDALEYLGKDMESELQVLDNIVLPQFELVIEAAEKSHHSGKLEKWLRKLKTAFYEAEDLLDEYEYDLLKKKAKKRKKHSSLEVASSSSSCAILYSKMLSNFCPHNWKLLSKVKELKSILEEAKTFRELLGLPASSHAIEEAKVVVATTTSLPPLKVFGRDGSRDRIIDLLTKETSADNISGVAIVGHGGVGKSTLAQYVYNDDRVSEYFDVKMWVCISRRLDVQRHTREIIETATKECPRLDSLDALQCHLRDTLKKSKNVLLVLDDVWFEESKNEMEWEQLLSPFVSQQRRSTVLVTSRSRTLPTPLHCKAIDLQDMEDAEFLQLFNHSAFSGEKIGDARLHEKLEDIASQIAKKLGKSPLVAKAVGSRLSRKKDITAWRNALQKDNLADGRSALIWSYEKLDPLLQRCFVYCSLFPKGHRYDINELVQLWIAEGFIDSCNLGRRMEDIGRDYLNEMVCCSFIQQETDIFGETFLIMHDLLHDLAQSLSKEDCFILEDDKVTEIPCTIRHLSVRVQSMIQHKQSICKLHHLRTIICICSVMDDVRDLFHQVLQNLKKLRVLYLQFYNNSKLPESIGVLKHLRYLNLSDTSIFELPGSLYTLYLMQILKLKRNVKSLPEKLCNLSKLRYFDGRSQIPNMGNLSSLQVLDTFSVKKEKGYELRQLRDLNELGGRLSIANLENVTGKDESIESMLHKKSHLECLKLVWSHENKLHVEDSSHLEILEGLRPPPQLKGLSIRGYQSATYPSWLLKGSYFGNLESFKLKKCHLLGDLPPNIVLFRHLCSLELNDVLNMRTLQCLPASVTSLSIRRCPMLMFTLNEELEQYDIRRENITREDDMVSRHAFLWEIVSPYSYLNYCLSEELITFRQLMTLLDADISQSLQTIESALAVAGEHLMKENNIRAWLCCHEQRVKLLYVGRLGMPLVLPFALRDLTLSGCSITDGALAACLGCLTSLEELSLSFIMTIAALPPEEVMQHLTSLNSLDIYGCWCLRSLGGLRAASSLCMVRLICCPLLELASGAKHMPSSLKVLDIRFCVLGADFFCCDLPHLSEIDISECRSSASLLVGHLTWLESFKLSDMPDLCILEGFPSCLVILHINRCPNISALPDLPASLVGITIWDCELLKENCREPNGESWPKIAHIPCRDIG